MGQDGSGPEFHVNFGSGRVRSHQLWVGLGWVKKIGPMSNSDITVSASAYFFKHHKTRLINIV